MATPVKVLCPRCRAVDVWTYGRPKDVNLGDQVIRSQGRKCRACGYKWNAIVKADLRGVLLEHIETIAQDAWEVAT